MKIKERIFPGTKDPGERDYEKRHRKLSRKAAAAGMVLLKNENRLLPLKPKRALALYGAGAYVTVKGGTGSGDVNVRETVSVYKGLKNAGYQITTEKWLEDYGKRYEAARLAWRNEIWEKEGSVVDGKKTTFFQAYSNTPFRFPAGDSPEKTETDTAIYVISRIAGEGRDRRCERGDYLLTEYEEREIERVCRFYPHVILALNTGGIIDLSFIDRFPNIEAVIYVQQTGMEGGNAFADILSGRETPGGKLTDSWGLNYSDYPNAETFSYMSGSVELEKYTEGIYVGYRWFDTFQIPVRYCFGYGLSYTDFELRFLGIEKAKCAEGKPGIRLTVQTINIGQKYAGQEVVQVYVSCPRQKLQKEYRRLAAFGKTGMLMPGDAQTLELCVPLDLLTSYDQDKAAWILEKGTYGIFIGNSIDSAKICASFELTDEAVTEYVENISPLRCKLEEIRQTGNEAENQRKRWIDQTALLPSVIFEKSEVQTRKVIYDEVYDKIPEKVRTFVDMLTQEELIKLSTGDISKGQGRQIGSAGITVPGSAGETSDCAKEKGLASIVLADGPAGLRLSRIYRVAAGKILPNPSGMALEGGFLCRETQEEYGELYYQYCTAFPVGTALAQSWDTELMEECGKAVAEEMEEFRITLWLAPGMNIHRNPLCGRNFEYYSEDPLLTGKMACAITRGVQSVEGCGTTIKHLACNNQEDNRMASNSVVSERALREIYLKGFEIAVKDSQPMAIMTSYNLINGIHAANNHELCTKVVRNEWEFRGLIMTDWTTTMKDENCTAAGCMRAGNDIVMPGSTMDHDNIREELEEGTLNICDVKRSVCHLVNIVWQSGCYETEGD